MLSVRNALWRSPAPQPRRHVPRAGDYNTAAERHLCAARMVQGLRPDLLITEATYSTTLRESKKSRERDTVSEVRRRGPATACPLCSAPSPTRSLTSRGANLRVELAPAACAPPPQALRVVQAGGKVLVPVSAVGRTQELLILFEDAWRRHGLVGKVPLCFTGGMTARANQLYRSYVNWTSQQLGRQSARDSAFAFGHVQPWDNAMMDAPVRAAVWAARRLQAHHASPCGGGLCPQACRGRRCAQGPVVLFATPAMLNGGISLRAFEAWAPDARNLVLLSGSQVGGPQCGGLQVLPRGGAAHVRTC